MTIVLAFQSSLDFWRRAPQRTIDAALASLRKQKAEAAAAPYQGYLSLHDLFSVEANKQLQSTPPSDCERLRALFPTVFGEQLHLMVPSLNSRTRRRGIISHVSIALYPPGSFAEVAPGIWVVSPALCFMQLAPKLPRPLSVELGMELCGRYRKDSRCEKGMTARPPLASPDEMQQYCDRAHGIGGRKEACRAARHLASGSRSPMESVVFELLTLPRKMGGRRLPPPLLNERILIPETLRSLSSKEYFEADFLWPKQRLVLEYDSNQEHTGAERIADDAGRKNALAAMGYTVITLTTRQLMAYPEFRRLLDALRNRLHVRACRNEGHFAKAQFALWRKLTNPARFRGLPGQDDADEKRIQDVQPGPFDATRQKQPETIAQPRQLDAAQPRRLEAVDPWQLEAARSRQLEVAQTRRLE